MRLIELDPKFLKRLESHERAAWQCEGVSIDRADGICFLCPVCFAKNNGPVGTHSIICWRPRVSIDVPPGPGRWEFSGTSFDDLTLTAASSSIFLTGPGCGAHFFITGGKIC